MPDENQIQKEAERAAKLMYGLAESCFTASEERDDEHNMRFETIGIVTIVTWENEDGNTKEDVAYAFETRRHYVKTGILQDILAAHLHRRSSSDGS